MAKMDPERECEQLVARLQEIGYYPAFMLDAHEFAFSGEYRLSDIESAIEAVIGKDIGYVDLVYEELENIKQWG